LAEENRDGCGEGKKLSRKENASFIDFPWREGAKGEPTDGKENWAGK
jgi:hypothetical protein